MQAAAEQDGIKLDVTALKKPDYFKDRMPKQQLGAKRTYSDYQVKNRAYFRDLFRRKQLV